MDANAREPWQPSFEDSSPWRWEWWKFGLGPEDLFSSLSEKYNTVPYRIQRHEAFHHDVSEIAHEAGDLDDFHRRLALRREERLQELRKAWDSVAIDIVWTPSVFGDNPRRWNAFRHFSSNRSLDSLILFFQSLLPHPQPVNPPLQDPLPAGSTSVKANNDEPSLSDTEPASPASKDGPRANLTGPSPSEIHGTPEDHEEQRSNQSQQADEGRMRLPFSAPPPPPRNSRRPSPPTLTAEAGVAKRRRGRPSKQGAGRQLTSDAPKPSFGPHQKQRQRPVRRAKTTEKPRTVAAVGSGDNHLSSEEFEAGE